MNRRTVAALLLAALWVLSAPLPARSAQTVPPNQDPAPLVPAEGDATRRTYLPLVQAAAPDVAVAALEITQAVQTPANSVPLVQGRPTVARIFLLAERQAVGNLTLTLSATRNGVALPGSPVRRTSVTARTSYNRNRSGDSVNVLLPAAWLSGNVVVTAQIATPDGRDAEPADNTRRLALSFRSVAPLSVTVVPIRYIHAPSGRTYAPMTSVSFPGSVRAMFPIPSLTIRMHAPLTFRGDVTFDSGTMNLEPWQTLLNQVLALKRAEGAPAATIYAAILPSEVLDKHKVYLAGLGSSARAIVAFDVALIPAHEIGHGLGRKHAPCGNPSGVDPNYPHAGATLGAYGYDTSGHTVYDPSTTDLMSYCEAWVSDYTYVGMLNDQVRVAGAAESAGAADTAPSILVRATVAADGSATLLPLYAFDAAPTPAPAGPYTVAFLSAAGDTLAEHPVELLEAEEHGLTARLINAVLPLPQTPADTAIAALELRRAGEAIAVRALLPQEPAPPQAAALLADGETLALDLAAAGGAPVLVRHLHRGGATLLALDQTDAALELPLNTLAGGPGAIELIPADRLPAAPSAAAASAALPHPLPDQPPTVWIDAPRPALYGAGIILDGYASDAEGLPLHLAWSIDGAAAGEGALLQIEALTGSVTVELRATDAAGQTAVAIVQLAPLESTPTPE